MRSPRSWLLASLLLALPLWARSAGVSDTVHNLSVSGPGTIKATSETQVCIFCHTPHNADPSGPLWNHQLPSGVTYLKYTSSTMVACCTAQSNAPDPNGATKLCLSCHDGTVALNVIVNSQGTASTVASNLASGASSYTTALATNQFALNTVGSTTFTNLTGQHPVGIPFPGSTTSLGASKADPTQFGTVATTGCIAGVPTCVTGGAASTAGAYIYLYGTAGAYSVECASCHNPHQDNVSGLTPHFLRVPSSISGGTCGACHIK